MFTTVIYIKDPATGLYWDGKVPGKFTETPEREWHSEASASGSFSFYLEYTAALKTIKRSLNMVMERFEVVLEPRTNSPLGKDTNLPAYFRGRINRDYRRGGREYSGLSYFVSKLQNPQDYYCLCQLSGSLAYLVEKSENPEFKAFARKLYTSFRARWVAVPTEIDFVHLKLLTPVTATIVVEDVLCS